MQIKTSPQQYFLSVTITNTLNPAIFCLVYFHGQ
ncbi:hypothetical protein EAQG_01728 [Escherichia coli TA464]|nr:hypothetical protein EAQG_01728 [Escherichia coli TA464]